MGALVVPIPVSVLSVVTYDRCDDGFDPEAGTVRSTRYGFVESTVNELSDDVIAYTPRGMYGVSSGLPPSRAESHVLLVMLDIYGVLDPKIADSAHPLI
jgi:hypothetical protein